MTFQDDLLAAMTARLRANPHYLDYDAAFADDEAVVAYEEDEYVDGYCETCFYSYDFIRYTIENSAGEQRTMQEREVDLGDLLRDLVNYS